MKTAHAFWCAGLLVRIGVEASGDESVSGNRWTDASVEVTSYPSEALGRNQSFALVHPTGSRPEDGWPVLFILHGHGRSHRTLLDHEETAAALRDQPFLVVLADTGAGWYLDSPVDPTARYGAAMAELIRIIESRDDVATDRSQWGVAGWSMGGFGAVRLAQTRPDRFSWVGSIIGLLDFPEWEGLPEGQRYRIPEHVFGTDACVWRRLNPIHHMGSLRDTQVWVLVAQEAFDRTMNERFVAAAREQGIPLAVEYLPGGHTFPVVAAALPKLLKTAATYFHEDSRSIIYP